MKLGKSFWIKLGVESFLIVFSVLLALALNEYLSARKEEERTKQALLSIQEELQENQKIIEAWHDIHQKVLQNITRLRNSKEVHDSLVINDQLQLNKIFSGTLIPKIVRSTAWETAKSTGIMQNLDLQLAHTLSDMYELQSMGAASTANKLIALLYERETHQQERVAQTLMLLQFTMAELVSQENYLTTAYDDVLKKLDTVLEE